MKIMTIRAAALALCAALAAGSAWCADANPLDAQARVLADHNAQSVGGPGPFDPGAGTVAQDMGTFHVDGKAYDVYGDALVHAGALVPDGKGDYVWIGSDKPITRPSPEVAGARELRLKIRELASQLFEAGRDTLAGGVAMPASFVNQDDFDASSSFGRYIAEQLFYELNQLDVPVREYRTMPRIMTRARDGEFALSRRMEEASQTPTAGLVLTGTYYFDKHNVFVNARLYRPGDGMVLRTANLVFAQTPVTWTMLKRGGGIRLRQAEMEVKSLAKLKDETSLEFMLEQEDLH
ncbi:FlgO family outer membrane protein [Desulfocurvus sp. DL9XJH121]